jgi:hypothetical protein
MSKLICAGLYLGGALALAGIVSGATATLSGDTPLVLAGAGVFLMYVSLITVGLRDLWRMDE